MNADSDKPDATEGGIPHTVALRMEELRSQYLADLPRQLQSLQVQLDSHPDSAITLLPEIYERLHAIAGSAGTFGYARLSRQAHYLAMQVGFFMNKHSHINCASLSLQLTLLQQTVTSEEPSR